MTCDELHRQKRERFCSPQLHKSNPPLHLAVAAQNKIGKDAPPAGRTYGHKGTWNHNKAAWRKNAAGMQSSERDAEIEMPLFWRDDPT